MQRRSRTLWVAEAGITLALAWVLGTFVKLWEMPFGGSVSLEMLPLFLFALRWGGYSGLLVGAAYGLLNMLPKPYILHWAQVLLDYPLPFAALGLVGYIKRPLWLALTAGTAGRFLFHFLSGIVFWASSAPEGMNPMVYSVVYNATYLLPQLAISIAFFYVLLPYAKRARILD